MHHLGGTFPDCRKLPCVVPPLAVPRAPCLPAARLAICISNSSSRAQLHRRSPLPPACRDTAWPRLPALPHRPLRPLALRVCVLRAPWPIFWPSTQPCTPSPSPRAGISNVDGRSKSRPATVPAQLLPLLRPCPSLSDSISAHSRQLAPTTAAANPASPKRALSSVPGLFALQIGNLQGTPSSSRSSRPPIPCAGGAEREARLLTQSLELSTHSPATCALAPVLSPPPISLRALVGHSSRPLWAVLSPGFLLFFLFAPPPPGQNPKPLETPLSLFSPHTPTPPGPDGRAPLPLIQGQLAMVPA